ncbi:bridging integrator 2a [Alosa sapidissima]|uniref:bridging integrator 2a n=1 Tax=Alosa sapidissima TaxID=34773 RepID=UPI001C0A2C56|nr:bridging integrator 2a [Alosa sapidissima]
MDSSKTSVNAATSPKQKGAFAKRVQRQFSRTQEKVLQRFGKSEVTKDEQFEYYVQDLNEQQSDGSRIYKDLKAYHNAVKVMREASKRLSHSLYDTYESDWNGLEDLGAIVEGQDLLWNDYETKILDQAARTMESYMTQFPDVKERVAKRNRKLVDYDSSRHHLEALESAKKRDDVKIAKAKEELQTAKSVYEDINNELKEELPVLFGSRIGCYVSVFQAISNLSEVLYKELNTINRDFQDVLTDLKDQHPDKVFVINNLQRSASMKRRSLISPRAWRASFSEFQSTISPRGSLRRKNPTSPLRSVARPSLEGYSPEPELRPTPAESIAEVRDDEVSSTHSEQPLAEALNGASGARWSEKVEEEEKGEEEDEEEEEEEKPQEDDKQGKQELTAESAAAGAGPKAANSNYPEAKAAEDPQVNKPDSSEAPVSNVVLENGEASDRQNAGADVSSTHSKGAAAKDSGLHRETVM